MVRDIDNSYLQFDAPDESAADRHLSGREPSLELALTGWMAPEMELNLINSIEQCTSI